MAVVIGVGQAGCNIAAEMARDRKARARLPVFLANSTVRDLSTIKNVPPSRWLGITEDEGVIALGALAKEGRERFVAGGMGADPQHCHTVMLERLEETKAVLTALPHDFEKERFAVVLFSGGGGTGAGAGPAIARAIRELAGSKIRIIAAIVTPSVRIGRDETEGAQRAAWNASFAIRNALAEFDGIVIVDNERLSHLGAVDRAMPRFNRYVAHVLVDMLLASEHESAEHDEEAHVVQQADTRDVVTALSVGKPGERAPGIAVIGRAVHLLKSPLGYLLPLPHRTPDLVELTMNARSQLSGYESTDGYVKAFLLLRAPDAIFASAATASQVGEARHQLEASSCHQVMYHTTVTERPLVAANVALTYHPESYARLHELRDIGRLYGERFA